jgi:hypothetical protein
MRSIGGLVAIGDLSVEWDPDEPEALPEPAPAQPAPRPRKPAAPEPSP